MLCGLAFVTSVRGLGVPTSRLSTTALQNSADNILIMYPACFLRSMLAYIVDFHDSPSPVMVVVFVRWMYPTTLPTVEPHCLHGTWGSAICCPAGFPRAESKP